MRVAVNFLPFSVGGGYTYFYNFLHHIGKVDTENEYFVFCRKGGPDFNINYPNVNVIDTIITGKSTIGRILYEQFYIPFFLKNNNIDVYYSPTDYTSVFSKTPTVIALRNLNIYIDDFKKSVRLKMLLFLARSSIQKASAVIFVSSSSIKFVEDRFEEIREKSEVIHHGVDQRFKETSPDIGIDTPYILTVSTIYHNKNTLNLIKAYEILRDKFDVDHRLVIAGGEGDKWYCDRLKSYIDEKNLNEKIRMEGRVDYEKLGGYYRNAGVFVFPSKLETFGHPLLEAMMTEVPVAATDMDVFREIAGDACLYFDPDDPEDIAGRIYDIIEDDRLAGDLVEKGKERVKDFSWEKTVRKTINLFEKVYRENK